MISPAYAQMMARYNRWQNDSLITAADMLNDKARKQKRGAFFGSIEQTFSHLLWGDSIWLSRFTGSAPPTGGIPESTRLITDWAAFRSQRAALDMRIQDWARDLSPNGLQGDSSWHSGALDRDVTRNMSELVVHFFNHQTHHRGQIHAMLTSAGAHPRDTDLFAMPETYYQALD